MDHVILEKRFIVYQRLLQSLYLLQQVLPWNTARSSDWSSIHHYSASGIRPRASSVT
jgi:hypothetical protein